MNWLFYGDNLDVLTRHIEGESVDLVYLDPPFNSNANYNVLFGEHNGTRSAAQISAFEDTWHWDESAAINYQHTVEQGGSVADALRAFRTLLGTSDMLAYLAMMAPRLVELRRVMKFTASIYLHCDPTASHYLKLIMDAVFGPKSFRNEIIWKRTNARSTDGQWPRVHDTLLFYAKSPAFLFYPTTVAADAGKAPHTLITGPDGLKYQTFELTAPGRTKDGQSGRAWQGHDPSAMGRHWANDEATRNQWDLEGLIHWPKPPGFPRRRSAEPFVEGSRKVFVGDIWTDIDRLNQTAKERLGYPTQKPEALLERIIRASSNEGDVVLDPFCGCGTAIAVAQRLKRTWIGIDVTHLAIGLIKHRLADTYGPSIATMYKVIGEPTDVDGARELAKSDPFQFQAWALGLVGARVATSDKRGGDKGIDGRLFFHDGGPAGSSKQVIFSVKAGHLVPNYVRDLRGVVDREDAQIGVLLSFEPPTAGMKAEAASAGFYDSPWGRHARLQLLTVAQLLEGRSVDYPHAAGNVTHKRAPRAGPTVSENLSLFDDPA